MGHYHHVQNARHSSENFHEYPSISHRFTRIWFRTDIPRIIIVIEYYTTYVTYKNNKYIKREINGLHILNKFTFLF